MIDKIVLISKNYRNKHDINNTDIKNNKDVIYKLFDDFPESKNIYYFILQAASLFHCFLQ